MLTLQLFLGFEEFPGLDSVVFKSQREIDTYLSSIFAVLGPRSLISDAGKSFICGCLAYDGERRPTAHQAFYHSWLQEPRSDRKMFKRLEADNARSWKPQRVKFPVIEDLTATQLGVGEREGRSGEEQTALQSMISPHFLLPESTGPADHRTHSEEAISAQGSGEGSLGACKTGQSRAKRKGAASSTSSAKRPKSSP